MIIPQDDSTLDEIPWSDCVTPYDRAHHDKYRRLLDADHQGASIADMARYILQIDPVVEPQRARRAVLTHLLRAEWMANAGYRFLLDG